ncbi:MULTISPECIES: hypothetical protein [Spirulina sp. CCY15215]|uniref:hypothetical protein n=1 Tax=Spirulina sp. CCY15215 TaxID=2767591 RepID=UPI00194E2E24|nr:hypothetical protein [Spirulina major]
MGYVFHSSIAERSLLMRSLPLNAILAIYYRIKTEFPFFVEKIIISEINSNKLAASQKCKSVKSI